MVDFTTGDSLMKSLADYVAARARGRRSPMVLTLFPRYHTGRG
jgi:hypothetical protein